MDFQTIYSVENLPVLNGPDYDLFQIWASRLFIGLSLFFTTIGAINLFASLISKSKEDKGYLSARQAAIHMILVSLLLFGGLGVAVHYQAIEYTKKFHRFQKLKTALQRGECQVVEGPFQRIGRQASKGYGCCYSVGDHRFYVPLNGHRDFDASLESICPWTQVRVWYAALPDWTNGIPEQMARIDIVWHDK